MDKQEKRNSLEVSVLAKTAARVKQLQKDVTETNNEISNVRNEISAIASNVNKKIGLITNVIAKNAARVKLVQAEIDEIKESLTKEDEPVVEEKNPLVEPIQSIADSLVRLNTRIAKVMETSTGKAVAAVVTTPSVSITGTKPEGKKEEGFFGLLKQLFSNPAVLAALAGIVYMVLPKEVTDKIKEFLTGFATGVEDAVGKDEASGFKGLGTALKVAGVAIATIFGAKMINGIIEAVGTMIKIFRMIGAGTKFLGKFGKAGAALGVAGALAGARAMVGGEEEEGKKEEPSAEGAPKKEEAPAKDGGKSTAKPEQKPSTTALPKPADTSPPTASGEKTQTTGIENAPELASVVNTQPGVDLSGIDPAVKQRLAAMAAEYEQKTGKKIQVNSGYRDPKKQAELYARIGPPKAAPPGKSFHEKGLAFDINSADANKAIELGLFEKYGFKRPVSGEPWHIEASETRGGPAFADNPASPGTAVAVVDKSGKPGIPATGKSVELASTSNASGSSPASAPGAMPEAGGYKNNSGSAVATASQGIKEAAEPSPTVQTASVNNSNLKDAKGSKSKVNDPIPSPIANRGMLDTSTKHSTAYA